MKRCVWLAAAAVVAFGTSAHAADLEVGPNLGTSYRPSPMLPGYRRSGTYLGIHVGYGLGEVTPGVISLYNNPASSATATIPGLRVDTKGFIAAAQDVFHWPYT